MIDILQIWGGLIVAGVACILMLSVSIYFLEKRPEPPEAKDEQKQ